MDRSPGPWDPSPCLRCHQLTRWMALPGQVSPVTFTLGPHAHVKPGQLTFGPSGPATLAAFLAPAPWNPCSPRGLCSPLIPLLGTPYSFPWLSSLRSCSSCLLSPKRLVPSCDLLVSFITRVSNCLISLLFYCLSLLLEYSAKGGALSVTHYWKWRR